MLKCGTGFSVCLCDYALESDEFLVFISNFVFHQHSPGIACFAIKCRFLDFQGEVGGCIFHNVAEMQNISQIEKKTEHSSHVFLLGLSRFWREFHYFYMVTSTGKLILQIYSGVFN